MTKRAFLLSFIVLLFAYIAFNNSLFTDSDALKTKAFTEAEIDQTGFSKLHKAINANDYKRVKQLIEAGADVNDQNNNTKIPPLANAYGSNNPDILKLLLEAGANTSLTSTLETPPVFYLNYDEFDLAITMLEVAKKHGDSLNHRKMLDGIQQSVPASLFMSNCSEEDYSDAHSKAIRDIFVDSDFVANSADLMMLTHVVSPVSYTEQCKDDYLFLIKNSNPDLIKD